MAKACEPFMNLKRHRKKSIRELGQELGGIGADPVVHAHERNKRKMRKSEKVFQITDKIYWQISQ